MLKAFKYKLLILVSALTLSTPMLIPLTVTASATCGTGQTSNSITANIEKGVNNTTGETGGANAVCGGGGGSLTSGVQSLAKKVVDLFSIVVGIVCVIMIIYAGFRYVTSGGESGSVSSAQKTLLYALIGLVIVVLAQLIVHYVLNAASGVATPTSTQGL